MKKHEYYEMLISRKKDEDLNSEEEVELKEHIKNCKSCDNFQKEINFVSGLMKGNVTETVKMNSKPIMVKLAPYFVSLAAILVFAFAVVFVWQNNYNNANIKSEKGIIALSKTNDAAFEKEYNEDYLPLSGYFNYTEENESTNDSAIIMSAYMQYIGN